MDINNLTLGQLKEVNSMFGSAASTSNSVNTVDRHLIGQHVIIRTYSAGVHFGKLIEKNGAEVILENSRRMYKWITKCHGISLSELALNGVADNSKICFPVPIQWLDAVEIIPCSPDAVNSISSQKGHEYVK